MTINRKYKPFQTNAISWEDIEHFYNDLISKGWPLEAIIPLVQYIMNDNNLNQKLFPMTSLDKLIISIYNPIEWQRETLHIHYEKEKNLWNFKYYPYPYQKVEHERNYSGELLVEKFQNYINMLGW